MNTIESNLSDILIGKAPVINENDKAKEYEKKIETMNSESYRLYAKTIVIDDLIKKKIANE